MSILIRNIHVYVRGDVIDDDSITRICAPSIIDGADNVRGAFAENEQRPVANDANEDELMGVNCNQSPMVSDEPVVLGQYNQSDEGDDTLNN
jgi:hypothetical protein